MAVTRARQRVFFAAFVIPNKVGGVETQAVELARQLDRRGWDLTVCFSSEPPPAVRQFLLEPGNLTIEVMDDQTSVGAANARKFFQLMRRVRPQVVLYTLGGVVRWWPLVARLTGARRVIYNDGTSRTANVMNYRAGLGVRLLMSPLSKVVCACEFVRNCSNREGIVPKSKSSVLYNSVDNSRDFGDGDAFRRQYGIPADRQIVLKVSWLVPDKGIDIALRAAQRALTVNPNLHFVFCGDGENREEYEQLSCELGLADHVTWTGQVEKLVPSGAFRAAAMQIQCSQWNEACCLAILEGMSAGLPFIASRIGGNPELVEDGVNGFLFEPRADDQLAEAILKLADDPELRARLGKAGRERSLARHDLVRNTEEWVRILLD